MFDVLKSINYSDLIKAEPKSIAGGLVIDWNLETVPHIIVE